MIEDIRLVQVALVRKRRLRNLPRKNYVKINCSGDLTPVNKKQNMKSTKSKNKLFMHENSNKCWVHIEEVNVDKGVDNCVYISSGEGINENNKQKDDPYSRTYMSLFGDAECDQLQRKCFVCEVNFKSEKEFRDHQVVCYRETSGNNAPRHFCQYCSFTYGSEDLLFNHMCYHNQKAAMMCKVCGLTYQSSFAFENHRKSHKE